MLYALLKPFLFHLDPERAHAWALRGLHYLPAQCLPKQPSHPHTCMGLHFPHRIGLAAGLDKSGEYLDDLAKIGFGFIEIGTVTPQPQPGNPKPRLFRIAQAEALINRMGFNNPGVAVLVANVMRARYQGILGINIGKGKATSLDRAVDDYLYCLRYVYPHASYVAINISSPNTPDLRQLQGEGYCLDLLRTLRQAQQDLAEQYGRYVPLVVKVSPDEADDALRSLADIIVAQGIDGIIATNTTCAREMVGSLPHGQEIGGLSGQALRQRATHCLAVLKQHVGDRVTLIGVGGIDSPAAAQEKIAAGADLLQVYTGLIYRGPECVRI